MSTFYLDASALVKRYNPEIGSSWIEAQVDPSSGHSLITAEFTMAEVAAALAAKHRAPKGITLKERNDAMSDFLADCEIRYQLIPVDRHMIEQAVNLTQSYRLRGYDAIHLATALNVNHVLTKRSQSPLIFVAADDDLLAAAEAEGVAIVNPNRKAEYDLD